MKKCTFCNNLLQDDDMFCRFCGKKVTAETSGKENTSKEDKTISSLFLKYAGYLDDNVLYRIAWAKEKNIVKSDYPEEAEEIFKLLAFKGHLDSIYHYTCILLAKNNPDYELAYKWINLSANRGHVPSINLLNTYNWKITDNKTSNPTRCSNERKTVEIPKGCELFSTKVNEVIGSILMINSSTKGKNGLETNSGSGFIIGKNYVVTNAHVIGDNPECIEASFEPSIDAKTYPLYPLVIAKEFDIAILVFPESIYNKLFKVNGVSLNTQQVAYGQEVFTIGNPLGIGLSVSRGVVSCPLRQTNYPSAVSNVIQTDITINHGNSGGALFNMNGEVIGITTFVPSDSEGGIGMCIPSTYIKQLLEKI